MSKPAKPTMPAVLRLVVALARLSESLWWNLFFAVLTVGSIVRQIYLHGWKIAGLSTALGIAFVLFLADTGKALKRRWEVE